MAKTISCVLLLVAHVAAMATPLELGDSSDHRQLEIRDENGHIVDPGLLRIARQQVQAWIGGLEPNERAIFDHTMTFMELLLIPLVACAFSCVIQFFYNCGRKPTPAMR